MKITNDIAQHIADGLKIRPNSFKVYNSKLIEKLNNLRKTNWVVIKRDDEFSFVDGDDPYKIDSYEYYYYRIIPKEVWTTFFSINSMNKSIKSWIKYEESK